MAAQAIIFGFSPIAAREGHTKMILHLLELGADPTVKDKFKKTPYNYCPDKPSRTAFRRYQVCMHLKLVF